MLDVTGFNEYNIKLDCVIGNDTRYTKIEGGGSQVEFGVYSENLPGGGEKIGIRAATKRCPERLCRGYYFENWFIVVNKKYGGGIV